MHASLAMPEELKQSLYRVVVVRRLLVCSVVCINSKGHHLLEAPGWEDFRDTWSSSAIPALMLHVLTEACGHTEAQPRIRLGWAPKVLCFTAECQSGAL